MVYCYYHSLAKYDFNANASYAFKCLTKEYPLTFALSLIFGTVFLLAILIRVFERPYRREQLLRYGESGYQDYESIENAIWCTLITLTTGIMFYNYSGVWGFYSSHNWS